MPVDWSMLWWLVFGVSCLLLAVGLRRWIVDGASPGRDLFCLAAFPVVLSGFELWPAMLPSWAEHGLKVVSLVALFWSLRQWPQQQSSERTRRASRRVAVGLFAFNMLAASIATMWWGYPLVFYSVFLVASALAVTVGPLGRDVFGRANRDGATEHR